MWLDFKNYCLSIILLGIPFLCIAQQSEKFSYNLKQSWEQYDLDAKNFMPSNFQPSTNTISFKLEEYREKNYFLYVKSKKKTYLFNESVLSATLDKGEHYFKIDSLVKSAGEPNSLFSIYGKNIKNNIITYIVTKPFTLKLEEENKNIRNKKYTTFFILISTLLLIGLAFIKVQSSDLFSQYLSLSKILNLNTTDEQLYQGRFFGIPGIQMIIWMSFCGAFIAHFLLIKFDAHFLGIIWGRPNIDIIHLFYIIIFSAGFFVFFLLKYTLISSMAVIFDTLSIRNVHYSIQLGITFFLLILFQFIITLDYFSIININKVIFSSAALGALFLITALISIRLLFILKITFIQIFLYICGTEIFLFIYAYILVVGS